MSTFIIAKMALRNMAPAILCLAMTMVVSPYVKGTLDRGHVLIFFVMSVVLVAGAFLAGKLLVRWLERRERRRAEEEFGRTELIDARIDNIGTVVIDSDGHRIN